VAFAIPVSTSQLAILAMLLVHETFYVRSALSACYTCEFAFHYPESHSIVFLAYHCAPCSNSNSHPRDLSDSLINRYTHQMLSRLEIRFYLSTHLKSILSAHQTFHFAASG